MTWLLNPGHTRVKTLVKITHDIQHKHADTVNAATPVACGWVHAAAGHREKPGCCSMELKHNP
jgi:hypothetical protein